MTASRLPGRVLVTCARCGPRGRGRRNSARGLCGACVYEVNKIGCLDDYPRSTNPTRDLVEDACILRSRHGAPGASNAWRRTESRDEFGRFLPGHQCTGRRPEDGGLSWPQIAARLGVTVAALEKARQRCGWPDPATGRPIRDPSEVAAERVAQGRVLV